MISQKVLELFISARNRQVADHRQILSETEGAKQTRLARLQRANDILNLTFKYGGDLRKAAEECSTAQAGLYVPQTHQHQHNSAYFQNMESALEKLAEVMDGNSVLEETFESLFEEVAYQAICRNYSNGRGFYFLFPFIGIVLNAVTSEWETCSLAELQQIVAREQERAADLKKLRGVVDAYNNEAREVDSPTRGHRGTAGDLWAIIGWHPQWSVFDIACDTERLSVPRNPGCSFWYAVHAGNVKAAQVLSVFRKHEPGIKAELAAFLRKWNPEVPEHSRQAVNFVLA